jgi:preprotein translocase subunit SecG
MTYDSSTGKFHYETAYGLLGIYSFTIWANDASGNWNTSSGTFEMHPKYGTIKGTVVDGDSKGIPDVKVDLVDVNGVTVATTNTDNNGNYTFNNVMAGTYSIRVSKSGYEDSTKDGVTVTAGDTTTVDSIVINEEMQKSFLDEFWWVIVILIVVIVLILVILLLTRKKKEEVPVEAVPEETEAKTEIPPEESQVEPVPGETSEVSELPQEGTPAEEGVELTGDEKKEL